MIYERIGINVFLTNSEGIEAGDFLERCSDFIVIERSFPPTNNEGKFYAYFLVKSGLSTESAVKIILTLIHKGKAFYYGLKDSNSLSVQNIVLTEFVGKNLCFGGKARLIYQGKTDFIPKKGGFNSNIFAIKFPDSIDAEKTLEEIKKLKAFPNFFGHQRFGFHEPFNHEIAIKLLKDGKLNTRSWKGEFLAESLQSYIFNVCLSRIDFKEDYNSKMGILLGTRHKEALKKKVLLKDHYECSLEVAEKLGILELIEGKDFLKYQLRPLFIKNPLIKYYKSKEKLIAIAKMPPGSYASLIIREVFKNDESWMNKKCVAEKVCK
ncbi:tRNA pseudouridine(13) synthase TruD [Fervidicoccus fontis]|uniref:tRNA pseudouridine(13) synthase TruD n=1 Tax=Fervidicoccus fontis TaxID=683846 RepID=A0A2J6N2C5_9CREN|nr:tRNA pseudouridine(13) synthase TruD [Fervidicoccus fontis]PMB75373.1 MAG: hypothetical protein C0188_03420 [Fervidicoccus fontis]PMB76265.1 MAG: hypothetical protein C0177_07110 [Fervidicoccus fontis]HEW64237.1 tRNA pseudouridine(13) synthase TruD [Fervidicoccus fontis]